METEPMNSAKGALPSPIALANANQPTTIVIVAMTGPTQVELTVGSCGRTGFVRRQSVRVPRRVFMKALTFSMFFGDMSRLFRSDIVVRRFNSELA